MEKLLKAVSMENMMVILLNQQPLTVSFGFLDCRILVSSSWLEMLKFGNSNLVFSNSKWYSYFFHLRGILLFQQMFHMYLCLVYNKINVNMICLTFLNLYPCVKLLLACAENAFVGNKIPAKIATFCVKRLMCSVIYLK